MVVFERGNIVRSRVDEVRLTGRNTAGVWFAKPGRNDAIVGVARNAEKVVEEEVAEADAEGVSPVDGEPLSAEEAAAVAPDEAPDEAPAVATGGSPDGAGDDTSAPTGAEDDHPVTDGVPSVDKDDADADSDAEAADEGDDE